jgi:hypothetical protein
MEKTCFNCFWLDQPIQLSPCNDCVRKKMFKPIAKHRNLMQSSSKRSAAKTAFLRSNASEPFAMLGHVAQNVLRLTAKGRNYMSYYFYIAGSICFIIGSIIGLLSK